MRDWIFVHRGVFDFIAIFAGILGLFIGVVYLIGGTERPQGDTELVDGEIISLTPDPYHKDLTTRWTVVVRLEDGRRGIVTLPSGVQNCVVGQLIQLREFESGHLRATSNCRSAEAGQQESTADH